MAVCPSFSEGLLWTGGTIYKEIYLAMASILPLPNSANPHSDSVLSKK